LGAAAADVAAVERLVLAAGTSFYRGMRVLAPDRRTAMYAIYAFCRIVDDIADEDAPLADKRAGLAAWRERIAGLYRGVASDDGPDGAPDGAVTRVLLPAIRRFALREADFLAVIDGMQSDAEAVIVAPTLAELDLYCDRVAAAVGRLSVRCFGDASPGADRVAWSLGRALQLTNILRDLQEDAERGRLYLPREFLLEAGVPLDATAALAARGLGAVCDRVAAQAHAHFADAAKAMAVCDRRAMRPARLMGATYDAILTRLEQRGWQRPEQRVSLPTWQKLAIALRYAVA
jgi:phytoene synthase